MASVHGVLGPLDTAKLGFTLMHEHVLIANWAMRQSFADYLDVPGVVARAAQELAEVRGRGIATHRRSDAHQPRARRPRAARGGRALGRADRRRDGLLLDRGALDGGLGPRDARRATWCATSRRASRARRRAPAIIKCATDRHGVTDLNRKLLEVTARAHRRTGVPISTHTSVAHHTGLAQQDVFEAEGVDLSRVVIGHCGDSEDLDYLERILRRGSTIGMDRFGIDIILPTKQRVATIAELCKRGFAGQMVLSHDASLPHRLVPPRARAEDGPPLELPPHPGRRGAGARAKRACPRRRSGR